MVSVVNYHHLAATVKLGEKELFGHPKMVPYLPNIPYHYEVNGKLVTGSCSLITICSLSNCFLSSLTDFHNIFFGADASISL